MKNQEILKKVIEKAVKNGYIGKMTDNEIEDLIFYDKYFMIIFSHDFAKCFWGNDLESWQYHLRQMVLEKEPLLYLKNFL